MKSMQKMTAQGTETSSVAAAQVGHWGELRACKSTDPELFFPKGQATRKLAEAKAVCGRCPVAAECLADALASRRDFGVWGGLSEQERRDLHKRPSYRETQSRTEQLLAEPQQVLDLVERRLSPWEMSLELSTNVATVNTVLAALAEAGAGGGVR